jgi:hypothetical protein
MTIGMAQKIKIHFIPVSSAAADRGRFPRPDPHVPRPDPAPKGDFSHPPGRADSCQSLVFARRTVLAISLSKSPNIEIVKSGNAKSFATSEIATASVATAIMPVFPDVMADAEPL